MQTNEPLSNPDQQNSSPQPVGTPPTTETPTSQESVTHKKITNWLPIGLVILLLVSTGVFAYKYYGLSQQFKNQRQSSSVTPTEIITTSPSPVLSPSPEIDSTADWETYTNTKHNYLLKYPPGFTFVEGPAAGSPPEVFQTWDTISFDSTEFGLSVHVNPGDAHGNPITCSADEECKSKVLAVLQKSPSEVTPFSSTVFGEIRTGFKDEISNPLYTTYFHYLVFLENDELWEISIYKQDNFPNYNLVNKILSTFKFTN